LLFGEGIDVVREIVADTPDGTGIGLDGFGLQPLELEMLSVIALEFSLVG